jgi:UDP-N-acetylmuramyl pentapeptide phosphotransferase/UDP-N-acetylglucosamine-1-phosphate transferase
MNNLFKYIAVFGFSYLIVLLLTPLFIRLAPRLGLMDVPDERCIHKKITPLGGGVVLFIAFHLTCYLLYHYFWPYVAGQLNADWWSAFFVSSAILLVVGLVDDRYGLSPLLKLAGQAAAVLCLYFLSGYQVSLLNLDFGYWGAMGFVLLWTLGIINAFNLIDGLDGLCSGLAMISATGLAAVFIFRASSGDALVCLAMVGACAGFLKYNFFPAKVFLGDTGSLFLGFALASISLNGGGKGSFLVIIAMAFFVAGIPIIDTLLAIWRRSIRKELAKRDGSAAVKIMQPDKDHLHHRLLNLGLKQRHVTLALYAANSVAVLVGLSFMLANELATGLFLVIFIIGLYLLIKYVIQIELWETNKLLARSNGKSALTRFNLIFYPLFDLLWMSGSVWLATIISLFGFSPFRSMGQFSSQLPLWLLPVFIILFASKVYIRNWRNSFFKDYLLLSMVVVAGSTASFALLHLLNGHTGFLLVNQLSLFCFFSSIGIVGIRTPHSFIKALSIDNPSPDTIRTNVLVYGAGCHGGLYLQERYLNYGDELKAARIVGFIDDNPLLRKQYVYGKVVLGDLTDLKALIAKYQIDQIILAVDITDNNTALLRQIAGEHGVKLMRWQAQTIAI